MGMVGRLWDYDHDRRRRRRLHHYGARRDLGRAPLPLVRASRRAHGFSLLCQRDHYADGGAWPTVDGLDGAGFVGSDLRSLRSRLVRGSVPYRTCLGGPTGAPRAGWLGTHPTHRARDLYSDHDPRRDAIAPAPVFTRDSDDADPAQDQRALVVGYSTLAVSVFRDDGRPGDG